MSGIGVLGGSFNPIHYGHLRGAEEIRMQFSLDTVLFVPTYVPPHKSVTGMPAYEHRKAMVERAISRNRYFALEGIEEQLPVPSFTDRTMQALREKYGKDKEFYFIIGGDDFANIHTWHSPGVLFSLCSMIVITRHTVAGTLAQLLPVDLKNDFCYKEKEGVLVHKEGKKVYWSPLPVLDISSSRIRSLVSQRLSIRYLTPGPVIEYIEKEKLYH